MQLSKEEKYKQLLFEWMRWSGRIQGKSRLTIGDGMVLGNLVLETKIALEQFIPNPPSEESHE